MDFLLPTLANGRRALVERQALANSTYAQVLRPSQSAYNAGRQRTLSVIHLRAARAALVELQLPAASAAAGRRRAADRPGRVGAALLSRQGVATALVEGVYYRGTVVYTQEAG